ncbi:uncharacterized protein BDCG_17103 [Blastomyces dermatitidis ER-3]|uniref:Uncharacterized protein n=1 Tax=Ajellomyces dermatitidis (strain ER-3 / ATCC MYA-2586) TaxID=559297 RepID=A0ABX2VXH7_AJEDR|nr:uncharacterized protein BDCG_17103 [Blastomyces dermatitidis ER-3]OAT01488.1 hypothetical protein BDCG_17103 [Blastomyces dermatitidis ER-3]
MIKNSLARMGIELFPLLTMLFLNNTRTLLHYCKRSVGLADAFIFLTTLVLFSFIISSIFVQFSILFIFIPNVASFSLSLL